MAKFSIIPKGGGTARYSGAPTYTGTYMKPGTLEFREIASPTPIPFTIGDYVVYSRTGRTYRLYQMPQVKKQAASTKYGGGFLYQNVQFKDDSYQLEICPFRDLVVGDNRVHFSTQPLIAVFDNVAGIAERIQACLEDMYGAGSWVVRLATTSEGLDQDTADLMEDDRDFSVSGVSCLGVLDKIYEIWPNVGWVFKVESGVNTIVIGGAGLNVAQSSSYGKGNGLLSVTRTVANADELANRLYVYGSNRNMLSRWYSQFDIKDAESVDIQNLMLPIEKPSDVSAADYNGWGITNTKRDPAKAFVEDSVLAAANLRPKTVYFDGSGDFKEIYPTIEGITIAKLLSVIPEGTLYRPDPTKYSDTSVRVDKVLSVNSSFDSGLAANNGRETVQSDYRSISASRTHSVVSLQKFSMLLGGTYFSPAETGSMNLNLLYEVNGTVALAGIKSAQLEVEVRRGESGPVLMRKRVDLEPSETTAGTFIVGNASFSASRVNVTSSDIYVSAIIIVEPDSSSVGETATLSASGTLSFSMERYRAKTFNISLRQLGFDISAQALLGEGKTIAMRSGNCVGRSFRISSTSYDAATDTWNLEVIRSNDESLSQWFPNSSYPIVAGDEFVLLDIAMPSLYVSIAEHNLLDAALELLADTKVEQWQYTPEVDAKFMVENSRTINAGEVIGITDTDVVVDAGPFLVDSVTINEGEAAIPTYKVTLRERKKKSYSDKASVPESTSTPVTTPSQTAKAGTTVINNSFFEEDGNGGVKLKDEYAGLWAAGFIAAGGQGSSGSGGGGLVERIWRSANLGDTFSDSANDTFDAYTINAIHLRVAALEAAPAGGVSSVAGLTGNISASALLHALNLDAALRFAGVSTTAITDGGTETPTIEGESYAPAKGDVVLYGGKEYLWTGSVWEQLGDEASWALKTITITGTGYLTGGGNLTENRTLDISATAKGYIDHGEAAYNSISTVNDALLGLQSQIDSVASRSVYDELTAAAVFADNLAAPVAYIEDANVKRLYLADGVYLEYDSTSQGVHVVGAGLWTESYVAAGGQGSSGGGGGGLVERIWKFEDFGGEFSDAANDTFNAYSINSLYTVIAQLGAMAFKESLAVTDIPTLPQSKITDLVDNMTTISNSLLGLQSQVDAVATRNRFDDLTATSLFVDVAAVSGLYAGAIELNGSDLATSLSGITSSITSLGNRASTLEGYFDANGNAKAALKLTTVSKTLWGQTYWTSGGVPQDVTGVPNLYIGATQVQTSNGTQNLTGIGSITAAGALTLSTTKKIYFGDTIHYLELDSDGNFHFSHGVYTESFMAAGGDGSSGGGGGGGVELDTVWRSLTTNSDSYADDKIHVGHVPDLTISKITGLNGNLTTISDALHGLQAQVDAVASRSVYDELSVAAFFADVTAASNIYAGAIELAGADLATTLSGKQATISDLSTIRSRADEGHTAYGWGNHANAGYFAASSFTAANIVSTLGTTAVNRATGDSAGENIATNFTTVGKALHGLQAQIDSVASRSAYDELMVATLSVDTIAAQNGIFAAISGELTGNATTASYLYSASYGVGGGTTPVYFSGGRPATCSYSFGNSSGNAAINNGTMNTNLFAQKAQLDSDGYNIASNMTTIGSALRSLQSQIDSVATMMGKDEIVTGYGYFDTLAVGADFRVDHVYANNIEAIGYVVAGGSASSSDARLKKNIQAITEERAISLLMELRGVEWDWNEKKSCLEGRHGSGLIAQEAEKVMPWMVLDLNEELSITYNSLFGIVIPGFQSHETRIQKLEREGHEKDVKIAELERRLNVLQTK